nr:uncharacterized protein LOC111508026 [Leptinotarsa decemlineata]
MADGESKTSYEAVHPSGEPNVLTKTIEGLTIDEPSQDELTENPPVADTDALSSRISGQEEDEEEQRVFQDDTSSVSTFPEMDDKAGKSDVFTKTSEEKVPTTDEASRDEPFGHPLVADEDAPSSRVSGPEDDGDEDLRVFQDDASSVSTFPEMDDKAGKSEVLTETTEAKVPTTDVTSRDEPVEHPLVDDKDAASSRVSNPEEDEEIDDKAGKPDVFMKTNEENVLTADELSFPLVTASDAQLSRVSDPEKDGEEVRRFQDDAISPSRIPEIEDKAGEPNVFMKTTEEKTTADEPSRNEPFDRDGPSSRVSGPEKDGEDLIQIDTSSSPRVSGPEKDGKDLSQIDTSSSPRVSGPEKNAEDLIQIDTSSSPRVSGPEKDGEGLIKLDLSSSPRVCGSEKNGDQSSSPRVSGQKDGEHITQIEHSSSSSPEIADETGQKIITEADVHYSSEGAPAKKPRMEPDFQRAGPSKPKGKSKLFTKTNKRKLSNTDESPREESAERDAPSSRLRGPEMPDEDLIQVVASSSSSSPDTVDKTESRLETVSPTVKQWCNFKKDNADAVIFFKKGDFYELLHMDALLAVKFLNLPLIEV